MFTGIITNIGLVHEVIKKEGSDLVIVLKINNISGRNHDLGCSIACNGICLTLIKKVEDFFYFQASRETEKKTTISEWKKGDLINIEFAMRLGDELGGHMVLGHVDGVSKILDIKPSSQSWQFTFEIPGSSKRFIPAKGSVTVNGTSLTVNYVKDQSFMVNIIAHTFNNTNFRCLKIGNQVNIEYDLIARYLDQLLAKHDQ